MKRTLTQTYKENLLQNARYTARKLGGRCIVRGKGNERKVTLSTKGGESCVVWFPVEARVKDLELDDLKEAIKWVFKVEAFSI